MLVQPLQLDCGVAAEAAAVVENQCAALWRLDVSLREKTYWMMLYESAARADEALCLNVEDLYPQDKRGEITAKGGATEWIHWQSGTAQLLPRLIARRTRGPRFLTDRRALAGTPTLDVCPETGRARLSYRRWRIFRCLKRFVAREVYRHLTSACISSPTTTPAA